MVHRNAAELVVAAKLLPEALGSGIINGLWGQLE